MTFGAAAVNVADLASRICTAKHVNALVIPVRTLAGMIQARATGNRTTAARAEVIVSAAVDLQAEMLRDGKVTAGVAVQAAQLAASTRELMATANLLVTSAEVAQANLELEQAIATALARTKCGAKRTIKKLAWIVIPLAGLGLGLIFWAGKHGRSR